MPNWSKISENFAKGDLLVCSNYRPIGFSKTFEKCVYKRVYSFLEKNNLTFKGQFSFSSGYSSNHTIAILLKALQSTVIVIILWEVYLYMEL